MGIALRGEPRVVVNELGWGVGVISEGAGAEVEGTGIEGAGAAGATGVGGACAVGARTGTETV